MIMLIWMFYVWFILCAVAPSVPRNLTVTQFAQVPEAAIIEWLPPLNIGEKIIGG
jgi:hypothetical protein